MATFRNIFFFALLGSVLSKEGTFFDPCNKDDIKCLSEATEQFLDKSANGLPAYDIKPIHPVVIPSLDVVVDKKWGLVFHFKNIIVNGMKNQKIHEYKMDTSKNSIVLKTKANLSIVSDITIDFTKKSKSFSGTYTASTTALGTSQYEYKLLKNAENGLEYFDVGPETNTCEIIGEPIVTIDENLQNALNNDNDAHDLSGVYEARKVILRQHTLCKIIEKAYVTLIHNLRAAAKILPKTAFFKDI